ncbi:MAG: hypothetical protein MOGMAGMI_01268 [Candidatus Omnitrophica bacterium]|nr:hypothetical protein [Candidatus Omnitrophota bacterium]
MRSLLVCVSGCVLLAAAQVQAAEEPRWNVTGHTHAIAVWQDLSGPGAEVPGLAVSYDMSVFDMLLGARHSVHNGSGTTANPNYPLTDGEAVVDNLYLGLEHRPGPEDTFSLTARTYAMAGDRTVARVFGDELPWGDLSRKNGAIQTPHFDLDLYEAAWKHEVDDHRIEVDLGTLQPARLPRFARGWSNGLKIGSFFYRAPITQASIWEKDERHLEQGRHPLRGVDVYAETRTGGIEVRSEALWVTTDPTPVTDLERETVAWRLAGDAGPLGIGLTLADSQGSRTGGIQEEQFGIEMDASVKTPSGIRIYGATASTQADRQERSEGHTGGAAVAGAAWKDAHTEISTQYQWLGENYDLIQQHKSEEYPSNHQGVVARLSRKIAGSVIARAVLMWLRQVETRDPAGDTLFGDPFFSAGDTHRGKLAVQKLELEAGSVGPLDLRGYLEHVGIRKGSDTVSADVDKHIWNIYGSAACPLNASTTLELSWRHFVSSGEWGTASFRSRQDTLELALERRFAKDSYLLFILQHVLYRDGVPAARGLNDYDADQAIVQCKVIF